MQSAISTPICRYPAQWLEWGNACCLVSPNDPGLESDIQVLQAGQGDYMGFIRLIAEK